MRVHVVSDVHGRADALARAGDGADALICLGDLLLFLDYADHGQGIFADLFGAEAAARYVQLRTAKRFDEAREFSLSLFASRPESRASLFEAAMTRQYAEMFGEEFRAKIEAVGEVDVLCTHIPPAIPELLYDTVARRIEKGSVALLDAIRATRPRYSIFGHVHQPLARRTRVGVTECLNVGHFRATGAPFVLQW